MADFAAAQKRIQERRLARAEALTAQETRQNQLRASQLTHLPPSLRSYAFDISSFWDGIRSPYGTRPAFRVGQVDAELLDEALLRLLKTQAGEGLKYFGAHLKDDYDAEITTALRAIMWKLSIYDHGQSYGASLQGLKYIDARGHPDPKFVRKEATRWQRIVYGLLTVGGRYGWNRWEDRLSSLENGYDEPSPLIRRLSRFTTIANTSHNIAAFCSFLVFLYNGRYRTLTDRLLRLRLVPASNQTNREVSFEFLNRQLVWHAFTEFLLFILPLVGIPRWRRWLARAWKKTKSTTTKLFSTKHYDEDDEDDLPTGELSFLPERTCAICYQEQNPTGGPSEQDILASTAAANSGIIGSSTTDITNPYETMPCGCIYCFVCLAQRIEAEEGEGFICLRCGETVKECRPWNGDVLVEKSTRARRLRQSANGAGSRPPSRRKSVMFADLEDGKQQQEDEEEEEEEPLSIVEPMPLEESQAWSEMEAHTGQDYDAQSVSGSEEIEYGSEEDE